MIKKRKTTLERVINQTNHISIWMTEEDEIHLLHAAGFDQKGGFHEYVIKLKGQSYQAITNYLEVMIFFITQEHKNWSWGRPVDSLVEDMRWCWN